MLLNKKSSLLILYGLVAIFFASCQSEVSTEENTAPNVVFILTDDQRWDAVSASGNEHPQTPNIDQLADEGVFFDNYFVTTSLCSPSRASILSGLYAHSHGVSNNFTEFPDSLKTFPRVLQTSGYNTAYIGKWHMGENNSDPRPGFDHFITHKGQGEYFDTAFNINGQGDEVVEGYYTKVVTDMAKDWLQEDRDEPFLLMLGHKAPHSFYTPEPQYEGAHDDVDVPYPTNAFKLDDNPDWFQKRLGTWHGIFGPLFEWREDFPDSSAAGVIDFENMVQAYWSTILSVDDSVGEIYEFLEQQGELDNTIFIFTSDNGLLEGEHGMVDKRTMHEGSIRVPLIIRYPGLTPIDEPITIDKQVLTLDLAPSILELAGAPPLQDIHGQSFVDLIVEGGTSNWRNAWYYEYNYEVQFPYTPNVRGVRTDEWKYIRYPHGDGNPDRHMAELYHIASDPEEEHNLVNDPKYSDKVEELQARLEQLMQETGEPLDYMPLDEGIKSGLPEESIR